MCMCAWHHHHGLMLCCAVQLLEGRGVCLSRRRLLYVFPVKYIDSRHLDSIRNIMKLCAWFNNRKPRQEQPIISHVSRMFIGQQSHSSVILPVHTLFDSEINDRVEDNPYRFLTIGTLGEEFVNAIREGEPPSPTFSLPPELLNNFHESGDEAIFVQQNNLLVLTDKEAEAAVLRISGAPTCEKEKTSLEELFMLDEEDDRLKNGNSRHAKAGRKRNFYLKKFKAASTATSTSAKDGAPATIKNKAVKMFGSRVQPEEVIKDSNVVMMKQKRGGCFKFLNNKTPTGKLRWIKTDPNLCRMVDLILELEESRETTTDTAVM
ncbi:hypothetical protein M569_08780 [Genlisea aurea]|uniref:Uncharacterized protein n=1 Tax=Genlisea aurea TaxID=192259 RepID=S8DS93_9LAMI|nr:hypothetical protein M569_08780 [Genlisea aurea]